VPTCWNKKLKIERVLPNVWRLTKDGTSASALSRD